MVLPRIVRSPSIWNLLFSPGVTLVLLKVMVGNESAAKKSALLRWVSRFSWFVKMLAVLMVVSTEDAAMFLSSNWIVPSKSLKRPGTLENRCRMLKPTTE